MKKTIVNIKAKKKSAIHILNDFHDEILYYIKTGETNEIEISLDEYASEVRCLVEMLTSSKDSRVT